MGSCRLKNVFVNVYLSVILHSEGVVNNVLLIMRLRLRRCKNCLKLATKMILNAIIGAKIKRTSLFKGWM